LVFGQVGEKKLSHRLACLGMFYIVYICIVVVYPIIRGKGSGSN